MTPLGGVEPLGLDHEVEAFDCGQELETTWLRRSAKSAMGAGTARVFVVCARGTKRVVGYYALTAGSAGHADGPPRMYKGVSPHYPVPVVLLSRMAIDTSEQGQGLGKALLVDALRRTIAAADSIGIRCLLVHCRSEEARAFYVSVIPEFEPSPTDALHLILLMKDLRAAVGRSGPSTRHGGRRE